MISNPAAVFFILAVVVFVSLKLEEHFSLFRSLGAALVGILIGLALSNAGIIPGDSLVYKFLSSSGVSAAVVLILLSVDVRSVKKAGPVMLKAFLIGAVGTALGSMTMALLLHRLIGPETWKLAGQFTGTYTGGGMNFAALGRAFDTSSDLFTAGIAADVIITAVWMVICLSVPVILGRKIQNNVKLKRDSSAPKNTEKSTLERLLYVSDQPIQLTHVAILVAIVFGSLWFSGILASWLSFFPQILWLTTIVLAIAQIPAIKKLSGGAMLGNYLLLLFLASNGAQSVVKNIINIGPEVFYYAAGTVFIHGIIIFGIGRLFKIDFGTLAVASQANVGGSASAMAMASARGYTDRFLPGIAVGLLGYAVGNYMGLGIATLMKAFLFS
jgi:uncharacterized membrane protein